MLYFENDYCEGAHPAILQKLVETNFEKFPVTAPTLLCQRQREDPRGLRLPGGGCLLHLRRHSANAVVIGSMLHRWEGVLAATTGLYAPAPLSSPRWRWQDC